MSAVDTLRDALYGNPPSPNWLPSREGTLKAFSDLYDQVNALVIGILSYDTSDDLPEDAPEGSQARVTNDPVAANNTYWVVRNGEWQIDTDLIDSIAAIVQPLVDQTATYAQNSANSAAQSQISADAAALTASSLGALSANLATYNLIGSDAPLDAAVSLDGRYISTTRPSGIAVPATSSYALAMAQTTAQLAPIGYNDEPIWIGSGIGGGVPAAKLDHRPYYRIPLSYRIPGTTRVLEFAQGRATTSDYSDSCISMKVYDNGVLTAGERVLVRSDGAYHIGNLNCGYDTRDGRLHFVFGVTPIGFAEASVTAPSLNPAGAIRVFSFYSDNPLGAIDCVNHAGTALPRGEVTRAGDGSPVAPTVATVATDCTLETLARDNTTPYWNIGPGSSIRQAATGKELLLVGNGGGADGGTGLVSGTGNDGGFNFVIGYDPNAAAGSRWIWRASTGSGLAANEPALIQRSDGRWMIDARHQNGNNANRTRLVAVSADEGATSWPEQFYTAGTRVSRTAEGSVAWLSGRPGKRDVPIMLLASLAEAVTGNTNRRFLTIYGSNDDGETIAFSHLIHPATRTATTDLFGNTLAGGPVTVTEQTGYSSMPDGRGYASTIAYEGIAALPDGTASALYRLILRRRFNLADLMGA